ncbi:sigma factor-like helix-turn-helix DNA-binding protein [Faecalitalea cylindroides]|uniref:sigma factor-like helix-turn-helix DNA-binding protein n=1 Tax=Faecalitalea cylindroides TaxID=39483 RepID=UPI00243129D7|nr:sigma factor-like helix-turn-helix DNA-binding protein [Faecalitalea cylindroides]
MPYNHQSELKKWRKKKEKEERLLRQLGVDETTIQVLRNYDYRLFLDDRRFHENEDVSSEGLFLMFPSYDPLIIKTPEKLLDEIEDVTVYYVLKRSDRKLLEILILLMQDYTIDEIAEDLHMSPNAVYKRLEKLKKKLK